MSLQTQQALQVFCTILACVCSILTLGLRSAIVRLITPTFGGWSW